MIQFKVKESTVPGRLVKALIETNEDDFELICYGKKSLDIAYKSVRMSWDICERKKNWILLSFANESQFNELPNGNYQLFLKKRHIDKELSFLKDALDEFLVSFQ